MNLDHMSWLNKCRVCNKEGSRNIFDKISSTLEPTLLQSVSSNSRLLEKLRYVTMTKVDEFDNKPKMLCDLCIIQLNVAYQFKILAVEVDAKHHQYLIENGVNVSPNSDNNTLNSVEQRGLEKTSTTVRPLNFPVSSSNFQHRRLIKSEPNDYEVMSDITIDTNTDLIDDFSRNGVSSSASNQPFNTSNMVCVRDFDLLRSNGDSDIEFINNCLPASFRHLEKPTNTVESHTTTTKTTTTIASKQLVIAASKLMTKTAYEKNKSDDSKITEKAADASEQATTLPKKKSNKVKFLSNGIKKDLRPKANGSINYSLVRRKKDKLINPVNKLRQKIKEENESGKHVSSKGGSQNASLNNDRSIVMRKSAILRNTRKKEFVGGKDGVQIRRRQYVTNKDKFREKLNINRRRVIINETDRFKFASMKTIDRVISTKN